MANTVTAKGKITNNKSQIRTPNLNFVIHKIHTEGYPKAKSVRKPTDQPTNIRCVCALALRRQMKEKRR